MQHARPRLKLVFATAVVAMLVDVITKSIAVGVLVPGQRVPLIGDHVWCALTRNAGAAFSWGAAYTVELALVVGGIIAVLAWRSRHVVSIAAAIAVGLVLGGAAGNLADRVFRSPGPLRGAVVDFVAIGWGPIFNAADVCVVIGVVILTWRLLAEKPSPAPV
ncbi:MAG TPA: signal peptidase II [Mycobacterium sp.]|nr:signal peptidase II [Mycobacterium sp.]